MKLRLAENLTSATAKAGDQVPFEVTEEVDVDGVPVIAKGGQALATVTDASPKKSMGRGGKLDVNVDSVRLIDGEKLQLRAVQDNKGGGHVGAMTGAMVATSIVFFPAAPLFLFIHGKDIVIPQGTEVTAFVQGDMKLDMAKFAPVPPGRCGGRGGVDFGTDHRRECAELRYRGGWELRGEHAFDAEPGSGQARHRGEEGRLQGLDAQHDGVERDDSGECGYGRDSLARLAGEVFMGFFALMQPLTLEDLLTRGYFLDRVIPRSGLQTYYQLWLIREDE